VQAQSGTGKTATFSIVMLQSINATVRETQALVLSPTRYCPPLLYTVLGLLCEPFDLLDFAYAVTLPNFPGFSLRASIPNGS
jgi:hypothetical protein